MNGLEDFLNDEDVTAEALPEVEQAPEPEVVEQPTQPRDESGRFAPKGEAESVSPAPVEEQPPLEHPALIGERRRRQEAERRLEQMEAERNQQPPAQPADLWENTPEWRNQLLAEAEQRAVAHIEERAISRSAVAARGKYQDFDDVIGTFAELARQNPVLERQLRDSDNPGEFAYTQAKAHIELQQHGGDLNALVAARVQQELAKAPAPEPKPEPDIPESLAGAQSGRGKSAGAPPALTLEDILRGN